MSDYLMLSELIANLQAELDEHGDLPVFITVHDGCSDMSMIHSDIYVLGNGQWWGDAIPYEQRPKRLMID